MGSLWGHWVPLVTILGSLWQLVGVPWALNGGFGGTLVCFVPPFLSPLAPFELPLVSFGYLWDHLWPPLGPYWGTLGLKWHWQDHTDEKKLPKLYI